MRDFPIFTTDYGVASLILKEIPYKKEDKRIRVKEKVSVMMSIKVRAKESLEEIMFL